MYVHVFMYVCAIICRELQSLIFEGRSIISKQVRVSMYVCMYACMYMHTYLSVCMYVCMLGSASAESSG